MVAEEEVYSKIVEKNQLTAEGKLTARDVAEVYFPILNDSKFLGVFEIYYDVTEGKPG